MVGILNTVSPTAQAAILRQQCTSTVLMVRPACFYSNPETALTNEFQHAVGANALATALREFDGAVRALRDGGINVLMFEDTLQPPTPDAVFPNNWLTTHADGTAVVYPMQPVSRRAERRADILQALTTQHGFAISRHIDLSHHERQFRYLEGTGSMVLDRVNRIAYACLSARTDMEMLDEFAAALDYRTEVFTAFGPSGTAIYHTNVMMCLGSAMAIVCLESIAAEDRARVAARLAEAHEVIPISLQQVQSFAGNMLELRSTSGEPVLAMSSQARRSLTSLQLARIESHARIVDAPIDTIEQASGGSLRCMLAEIFLPLAGPPALGA